jgi:protein phosphatase
MNIKARGISDVGILREHNEDSFSIDEEINFYIVADGMGGHVAGGRASKLAVEAVEETVRAEMEKLFGSNAQDGERKTESGEAEAAALEARRENDIPAGIRDSGKFRPKGTAIMASAVIDDIPIVAPKDDDPILRALEKGVQEASAQILAESKSNPQLHGMGTTTSCLLIKDGLGYYAHVGDSRIYRFRDGGVEQITEDHSLVREQIKAGIMTEADAKNFQFKNIITRSVGFDANVAVDTGVIDIKSGDRFLMCSDGLSNLVSNEEMRDIIATQEIDVALKFHINLANSRGGDDNITIIIIEVD